MIGRRLAAHVRTSPGRMLDAVRMLGVGVVSALGQLVVDMPSGYLGAASQATEFGLVYAVAVLLGALVCGLATLTGRRWGRWLFAVVTLAAVAVFLPALGSDVAVAGSIVAWQLGVLAKLLARPSASTTRFIQRDQSQPARRNVAHLLALSIFTTTLVVGFEATDMRWAELICLGIAVVAVVAVTLVLRRDRALPRATLPVLAGLIATTLIVDFALTSLLATLGLAQAALLLLTMRDGPVFAELIQQFVLRPALLVLATFAAIAGVGALALSFPAAATSSPITPIDALFTSMSATCVTGLAVVDTPTAYTPFGETIILILIQVGGLGMMVLSTFATVILGGRLTLRGEQALGQVLELSSPGTAYRLVRFIVVATLAIEAIGALLLTVAFMAHDVPLPDAIWRGVFHSVSAFCNAGFALQTDSIVMFQSDPFALAVHALLITFGGLGFVVLSWLWMRAIRRERSRPPVQVRVVLWLSAALVIGGALLYALLEWRASLAGLSSFDKLSNALFQSVSTRTAGFNSVDLTSMQPATILLTIGLMFVGASPGGTGGGIKVTTLAVLTAAIPDIVGTRGGATLFGRSIAPVILQRAATITVVAAMTASLALFLLLISEDAPFEVLAFEVVSALGTVGLSLGLTGSLSATGKLVIIATMFIGRVGPLTLALALGRRSPPAIAYPETRIMVG
ncbi:TrkH family potassium uptake protein [Nannocystaceae bacterium ST9]